MPGVFNCPLNSSSEVCWSTILKESKTCGTLVSSCSYSAFRGLWTVSLSWTCKRQLFWHGVLSIIVLNPFILDSFWSDGSICKRMNLLLGAAWDQHTQCFRCSCGSLPRSHKLVSANLLRSMCCLPKPALLASESCYKLNKSEWQLTVNCLVESSCGPYGRYHAWCRANDFGKGCKTVSPGNVQALYCHQHDLWPILALCSWALVSPETFRIGKVERCS